MLEIKFRKNIQQRHLQMLCDGDHNIKEKPLFLLVQQQTKINNVQISWLAQLSSAQLSSTIFLKIPMTPQYSCMHACINHLPSLIKWFQIMYIYCNLIVRAFATNIMIDIIILYVCKIKSTPMQYFVCWMKILLVKKEFLFYSMFSKTINFIPFCFFVDDL